MKTIFSDLLSSVLLSSVLLGCGGGSSGVDSGLPADKKGRELAADEASTLCQAQADHLSTLVTDEDVHHFACVIAGMTAAAEDHGSAAACQIVYDMCIKMEPEPAPDPVRCILAFEPSTCNATVADIEACMTEKDQEFAEALKVVDCDDLDDPPSDHDAGSVVPSACEGIASICPGRGWSNGPAWPT